LYRKANKTFIKTWLAERKTNIVVAIQAQKRKRPQRQAQIGFLDSEEDDSNNRVASAAELNATEGTASELRDAKNEYILCHWILVLCI
jgi:hypothetical protein